MKGGAQCHPVPKAVGSILGHGLNVRGLGLGPPAAVDDPETADRAGVVVGPLDTRGEHPVAKRSPRQSLDDWPVHQLQPTRVAANPFADAESPSFIGSSLKSRSKDQAVLGILQEPYRTAEPAFVRRAVRLLQSALVVEAALTERNRTVEFEIVFDVRVVVVISARITLDTIDPGRREIGLTPSAGSTGRR